MFTNGRHFTNTLAHFWTIFFTRPASIVFLILTAVFIYFLAALDQVVDYALEKT